MKSEEKDFWYLGTGQASICVEEKNMLLELDESIGGNSTFGGSSKILVKGRGWTDDEED